MPYTVLRADSPADSTEEMPGEPAGTRTVIRYKPILLSGLLPGSGQLYQGQNRGYLYLAAEVASIAGWVVFRNQGGDAEEEYIDYAWINARENISTRNIRGDDEYYEHLARWTLSGQFDTDNNYDLNEPFTIDPWTEFESWNGEQWRIATINYFDPDSTGAYTIGTRADSLAALQYYSGRAYQSDFYWDWTKENTVLNYRAVQNQYLDLRSESNQAYQRATLSLIVLMANHAVSVVDAFISAKIELPAGGEDDRTKLDFELERGLKDFPGGTIRLTHRF
ncbi:MAG: hypothetical protein A2Z06_04860 [Candidatus Glassbacteria bacterium RBG_16_58_8]|uniref:DUF5683 domain-containing protein n=1 Tax=Candidatus Glassbacteria bacterium RBG_16_58_8 TaxID=1817866 RepID=A0A1F5YBF6_9BACT|nr:MAG: hypothetical protein A2Z06_04860 [Candidatus Glassbacteria bacterium RBG_16_58_8]